MIKHRIVETPAFDVIGQKTWISGQDNELFSQFWVQCRADKLFERMVISKIEEQRISTSYH